jgi:hypothetical protein
MMETHPYLDTRLQNYQWGGSRQRHDFADPLQVQSEFGFRRSIVLLLGILTGNRVDSGGAGVIATIFKICFPKDQNLKEGTSASPDHDRQG